jgi:hypothetical protein
MSDPFRTFTAASDEAALSERLLRAPSSRALGREAVADLSRLTGSALNYIQADGRRAFQRDRAQVFGEAYGDVISAEEANKQFGIEGRLTFDKPVSRNMAAYSYEEQQRARFNEETAASADLSVLDAIGASLGGALTDPIQTPLLLLGGEGVIFRSLGGSLATRGGAALRGGLVGGVEGLSASVAMEGLDQGLKRSAGREAPIGESVAAVGITMLFGGGLGASLARPSRGAARAAVRTGRASPVDGQIAAAAQRRGVDADVALRIRQLENASGDPQARPVRKGRRLSSAHGVFQITDGTWRTLGGGDRNSVDRQIELGIENIARERDGLKQALGRDPAGWEVYLAHQQGQGGARALLAAPDTNAIQALTPVLERGNPGRGAALARKAVLDNGGSAEMTAGEFSGIWRTRYGAAAGVEAGPRVTPLDGLTENERAGGLVMAVDAAIRDEPVDMGPLLARRGLDALDEADALPVVRGRYLEADTAVTRRGTEVPVRFAVVELQDLISSHSDDLTANPDYPAALQPRDRSRPGSQAENYALERDFNPSLVMRDKAASGGAPIVSPSGEIESGNGRLIALRRSAATGTEAWGRYQAELAKQGIDTTGFSQPVLVRMRSEPMSGASRADLAREMNASPTEAYAPVEQARSDARRMDPSLLGLIEGDDVFDAANRPFARGFMARVAPGEANALTDAQGALNLGGRARIQAALTQAAYRDDSLTAAVFETGDETIRSIGRALADAAPAWARMRAEAPEGLDLTANLTSAVALVRDARAGRMSVGELLASKAGQSDLFNAETISPGTEAFLRIMFRDGGFGRARSAAAITDALRDYARRAAATPAGEDLFGEVPHASAYIQATLDYLRRLEGDGSRGLAYAGGAEPAWTGRQLADPVLDLRRPEPQGGDAAGPGVRPGEQPGAEGAGGRSAARPTGPVPLPPEIANDPELRAILDDTEALAREAGIKTPDFEPNERPETWAAAIRAAAICLAG